MIKASFHPILIPIFARYTKMKIRLAFRNVYVEGRITDRGLPMLFIANHFSWWDGFWFVYVNLKHFGRNLHYMMLEEELKKRRFLSKIGGYSIKRGGREALESINYTLEVLRDSRNMVLLFPQGEIESHYKRNILFGKGILRVIDSVAGSAQIVFAVNLVEYYSFQRPSLYMYLMEFDGKGDPAEAYNAFMNSTLEAHISKGERS